MVFKLMIADFALPQNIKCVGIIIRNTFLSLLICMASFSVFYSGEARAVDLHEFEFGGEYVNNETLEVVQWSLRYVFDLDAIGLDVPISSGQRKLYPIEEWYLTLGSANYSYNEASTSSPNTFISIVNDVNNGIMERDEYLAQILTYDNDGVNDGIIVIVISDDTAELVNDVNLFAGGVISVTPSVTYSNTEVIAAGFLETVNQTYGEPVLTHKGGRTVPRRLAQFEISTIPDVQTNQPFGVDITARLDNGSIDTGFNSCVELSTNHSTLTATTMTADSREICLTNGAWSDSVMIRGPGATDTVLEVDDGDIRGSSNKFSVVDPLAVPSTLSVNVSFDSSTVLGIFLGTAYLENPDGSVSEQRVLADGSATFTGLLPGVYKLWAVDDSGIWRSPRGNDIQITVSQAPKTQLAGLLVKNSGLPPVLVLPGIMGSTINGSPLFKYDEYSYTPILPKERAKPSELRILNGSPKFADAGFDDLDRELSDFDYNVITVPWDWRASIDVNDAKNAIDEYLIPALDKAKDPDGDGIDDFTKVDVVAHSMGGLLVRAYIQSEGYDNDIRRFAMVGTPNEGSANTYYMIQGGDPQKSDAISGTCTLITNAVNPNCFYSRATDMLYRRMNDGESAFKLIPRIGKNYLSNYSKPFNETLVDFYRNHVPTGLQLQATFDLLSENGASTPNPLDKEPNTFLNNLNDVDEKSNKNRMAQFFEACNDSQKVSTEIFASNSEDTLDNIQVETAITGAALYPDGVPKFADTIVGGKGDGTVPIDSALSDSLDVNKFTANFGEHAGLVGKFKTDIRIFLQQECPL
jgi:pimeloyl-ACP methyl ester carboxylesterase